MTCVAFYRRILSRRWAGVFYAMVILVQVGASSDYQQQAPTQYYEQQQQQEHSQSQAIHSPSTAAPQQGSARPERFVPHITSEHVALSLRLTCERNRRLIRASTLGVPQEPEIVVSHLQEYHIKVSPPSTQLPEEEATTIFHATSRRPPVDGDKQTVLSGVEQWGPKLQTFITELTSNILELTDDETSIVLSLSMIYLDRASSVETLRSSGAPPCPFSSFRTVHRLLLSSILTAAQVVGRKAIEDYHQQLEELTGVSAKDLQTMMTWMKYALGDSGHFVGLGEMQEFKQMWERVFFRKESPNPSNDGNDNPSSSDSLHTKDQRISTGSKNSRDGTERAPSGFFTTSTETRTSSSSSAAAASSTSSGAGVGGEPAKRQQFSKPPAFVHSKHSAVFAA